MVEEFDDLEGQADDETGENNKILHMPVLMQALQEPTPKEQISYFPKAVIQINGQPEDGKAMAVPTFDARFTQNRLDEVLGPLGWQSRVRDVGGIMVVGIGIYDHDKQEWIWKWDTGMEKAGIPEDRGGAKGVVSQGFKRCGYQWGIGRDTYGMDVHWVPCKIKMVNGKPKFRYFKADPRTGEKINDEDTQAGNGEKPQVTLKQARQMVFDYAVNTIEMSSNEAVGWINDHLGDEGESIERFRELYKMLQEIKAASEPPAENF